MSSLKRPLGQMVAEVASIASAVFVVGVSYGALATEANFPWWIVIALAVTVLSASAELMFIASIIAGAAPLAAAVAALAVNLRNGVYGIAASRFLSGGPARFLAAHFVNDESIAYGSAQKSTASKRRAFWMVGWAIFISWPLGAAVGVLIGHTVPDVSVLGLDAVFPVILLTMVIGAIKSKQTALVVLCGALLAVVATPIVPTGLAPLIALAALALLFKRGLRRG